MIRRARVIGATETGEASAQDDGGKVYVITGEAVKRSRGLKGPTGRDLVIADLVIGTVVELDVLKGAVHRIKAVASYPDGAADEAAAARKREQEARRQADRTERERRAVAEAQEAKKAAYTPGTFNPYTFLPFRSGRPESGSRPRHRTAPVGADGIELLSGRIRLRLDLATPVVTFGSEELVDATHGTKGKDDFAASPLEQKVGAGHAKVSLLRDAHGRPTLPGSSLKGTLRSWLEYITGGHRAIAPDGVAWREPGVGDDGRRCGLLLLHEQRPDGTRVELGELRASPNDRLPDGVVAHILPLTFRGFKSDDEPVNSDARAQHRVGRMWSEWRPAGGVPDKGPIRLENGSVLEYREDADREDAARYGILQVGVGEAGSGGSIRVGALPAGMTREDVASIDPMVREDVIEVSRQALEVWWEAHRGGGYSEKDWSVVIDGVTINLSRPDARRLRHAYPVFYREGEQGITYLSVIRGGRNAVTTIPPERYPHGLPADEDDGLDAARRMFGRVPAADAPDDDTQSAWAGRIRFGPVHYEGGAQTKEFTLKPLMSPKVQSAGHYLQSDAKDGGVAWSPGKPGRLAGTKVYWHQPPIAVPGAEMDVAERVSEVATIKGTDGADARMKTNRTVEALVDGSFRFDIWFEDLDEGELGALLLAASLRFVDVGRVGWRIGLARPLGFGSVVNVIEQVDVVAPSGPTSLVLRRMDDEAISSRLSQARERWFGVESVELAVAGGIASLDSFIDMSFGYPGLKSGRYNPKNQTYQARPSAREELSKRPAAQPPKGA